MSKIQLLRQINNVRRCVNINLDQRLCFPLFEQVRWYRKSRWILPKRPPSKAGIYFHHPKPTENDVKKSEYIYKSYNTLLKSIVAAFQDELLIKEEKNSVESVSEDYFDEEKHHAKCMAYNDACNEELRNARMERINEILEEKERLEIETAMFHKQQVQADLDDYENVVKNALEDSENWVTLDNVEEKIKEAMDNVVNFNFAVRKDGRIAKRTMVP